MTPSEKNMTYADRLAEEIRMEFLSQKLDFSTALQKAINQAMQAQKQADAEAVLEVIQMESGDNFNMGFYSRMQQAILHAEVKP